MVLSDVFESGPRLGEAVALLAAAGTVGVWGNHDLGLCHEPEEPVCARYAGPTLEFMRALRPRLELGDCLFTHGLPQWDPGDPAVYYLGDRPETTAGLAGAFAGCPHPILFVGHFHRWLAATPAGPVAWDGRRPLGLDPAHRWLVVIAAVCDGWCVAYDTDSRWLTPLPLDGSGAAVPPP